MSMHKMTIDSVKPFNSVRETVRITGLSERFIRDGVRSGDIPCVRSGAKYLINLPALLRKYGISDADADRQTGST